MGYPKPELTDKLITGASRIKHKEVFIMKTLIAVVLFLSPIVALAQTPTATTASNPPQSWGEPTPAPVQQMLPGYRCEDCFIGADGIVRHQQPATFAWERYVFNKGGGHLEEQYRSSDKTITVFLFDKRRQRRIRIWVKDLGIVDVLDREFLKGDPGVSAALSGYLKRYMRLLPNRVLKRFPPEIAGDDQQKSGGTSP